MSKFERFPLLLHFDVNALIGKGFRRSLSYLDRCQLAHLKDQLWIFLRVVGLVMLIGSVALLAHVS
jgi:hypothetical protein